MKMTSTVSLLTRKTAIALWLCCCASMVAQAQEQGPLWFEGKRPSLQARQAVELLATSATHGLEPQDYNASALRQGILNAAHGMPQAITVAQLDQALTSAMENYLKDLHQGRIDPKKIQYNFNPSRKAFDPAAYLQTALAARRLPQAAAEAAPHLPLYEALRTALAHYRQRGDDPAWQQPLPALPGSSPSKASQLAPGQRYAGLSVLAQRLVALGDLAPDVALPTQYDGLLVPAVQSFQKRHGIAADGVIGKSTLVQLQVTPAARARQIELALERLRWTPFNQGPRMIVINIPEFILRAYDIEGERIHVRQEMKIVVGKALNKRTPLFNEEMRFIEFSPYWNLPASIARAETIPQLRRDPGYLAREGMEFVSSNGAVVDRAVTPARLNAVLAGQWRIRQRPGPKNALGDIKFVFPNTDNIYLHHTPAVNLFERERRDFSHGCIRVEKPVALAKFVLGNLPQWSEERIKKAMSRGESSTLRLTEPIPVVIAYETTLVKEGGVYFFEDIYGLDRRLDAALRQHTRYASFAPHRLTDD